jgi:hypothetical protein
MKPIKLPRGSDKEPMAFIYQQAIRWELVRSEYLRRRGDLKKAQDASRRVHFYQREYDALPEHSHIFKRDLSDRSFS